MVLKVQWVLKDQMAQNGADGQDGSQGPMGPQGPNGTNQMALMDKDLLVQPTDKMVQPH